MTNAQNSGAVTRTMEREFWNGIPVVAYHWNILDPEHPIEGFRERHGIAYHWSTGPKDAARLISVDDVEKYLSTPAPSDQAGWQDIALAPFNELVWCFEPHDMGGFMFAGGKNNGGNWYNNLDDKRQYPTHWMPLPTAPTLTAGEGGF